MRLPIWFRLLYQFLYLRQEYRNKDNYVLRPLVYRKMLVGWTQSTPDGKGLVERAAGWLAKRWARREIAACKQLEEAGVVAVGMTKREGDKP